MESGMTFHVSSECTWVFFFSSRRRHTRWNCDWSSDCALPIFPPRLRVRGRVRGEGQRQGRRRVPGRAGRAEGGAVSRADRLAAALEVDALLVTNLVNVRYLTGRSEERRVGKECRCRWAAYRER